MPVRPPSNLPAPSARWQRSIENELDKLSAASRQNGNLSEVNNKGTKNSLAGAMKAIAALQLQQAAIVQQQTDLAKAQGDLAKQQTDIAKAQADLVAQNNQIQAQQALLTDVANVQQNSFVSANGLTGFTGFYTGARPSVTLSTQSGRIQLQFGGSLNSGNGVFAYGVTRNDTGGTVVSRTTVYNDYSKRVALSGGASFTPSASSTVILTGLPRNVPLSIQLEMYALTNTVYFFGGSILASPAL